jgi:hypothetical protein
MKKLQLLFAVLLMFSLNQGKAQNALAFDGVNDYVQTGYAGVAGNGARTMEAWINTTANTNTSTGGHQIVIADYGTFVTGGRFTFNVLWGGAIRIEVGGNGLNGTTDVTDGVWHHVAVVYDPMATNNYSLYVDGLLENSGNLTVSTSTGSGYSLMLGMRVDGNNYFSGLIDEFRFWNTARTATQIAANMNNSFCGGLPNLVAYYKFNQGIAGGNNAGQTTLIDHTNSVNNGVLNNFSLSGTTSNWVAGKSLTTGTGTSSSIAVSACDSLVSPSGLFTWTSSNTNMDTISNTAGCDSVITVNLTIKQSSNSTITEVACNSYVSPSGQTHTQSGTYTATIPNAAGCDSVITINLTLEHVDISALVLGQSIMATTPGATYQWLDCNNNYAPIPGANAQTFFPTQNGDYAFIITEGSCTDTSICFAVTGVGINQGEDNQTVVLYPNPTSSRLYISFATTQNNIQLEVMDLSGKIILQEQMSQQQKVSIDTDQLSSGMYYIKVTTEKGPITRKFVVE